MDTNDEHARHIFDRLEKLINEMVELQDFITQNFIYKKSENYVGKINPGARGSDDTDS